MRIFPDFHLEFSEGKDSEDAIRSGSDCNQVLFSCGEVSRIHVPNHAANFQRFHVCILERYKSTSVHDDAQEVDIVVFLAKFVTPVRENDGISTDLITLTS